MGDPSKAHKKLGWKHETDIDALCAEMVSEDLKIVEQEKRRNAAE
jgi:GDPmannose 4,6-dehydratase